VGALARDRACTPGQLALAWVLARDPHVVPIPGTRRRSHLDENVAALDVALGAEELARLEATFPLDAAAGGRYPAAMMDLVNR
jgi:aryl-alcohol dehydrogenase-like predicted oxidoreductase